MTRPQQLKCHNFRVFVTKTITFDSAHFLYDYEGSCANIHGHTYKLEVTCSGYPNEIGMVIDFKILKSIIKKEIIEVLDHKNLNEVLSEFNTTAENIVYWIWERLQKALKNNNDVEEGFRIEKIKLYETPTSYAEIGVNSIEG